MKQISGEPGFIVSITEKVADGDLTVNLDTGNKDVTGVTAAVKKMVVNLRNMVLQVLDGASETQQLEDVRKRPEPGVNS